MKKRKTGAVLVLVLAASGGLASATMQQDENPNRQEVERMMEAYILSKLQDSLELSDEQFGQMVVAQTKLQDTRRAYRQERMGVLRELRQSLRRGQGDDAELDRPGGTLVAGR